MEQTITIDEITDINPEAMLADGFDDAILGVCVQFGSEPVAAYDFNKCVEILMSNSFKASSAFFCTGKIFLILFVKF